MSDPVRLRDDTSASPEARALLNRGLATPRLPHAVRERSAARLDRALVLPAAAGLIFWMKGVALATGVVVAAVAAPRVLPLLATGAGSSGPLRSAASAPAARGPAVAPVSSVAGSAPRPLAVEAPPPSSPSPVATTPPAPPRPPPDVDPLTREAAMLERARAALARDPASALAILDAHEAEFPKGALVVERELVAVQALARLGRMADARARGETLLHLAQGSIYEARVRAVLDGMASE